jgi:hypothetical protein
MTRTRIIGLSLATAFAMTAIAVSSASAFAPEFGRCLKQATKSLNNFDSRKCVKLASEDAGTEAEKLKKGNYQWFSGVVSNKFTTAIKPATIVTIESVTGAKSRAPARQAPANTPAQPKWGHVVIRFTGCESKVECATAGQGDGHITTVPLSGSLGFETITEDTPSKDHLALELYAEAGGNVMEFECFGVKALCEAQFSTKSRRTR